MPSSLAAVFSDRRDVDRPIHWAAVREYTSTLGRVDSGTELTVDSGNATRPALITGRNVELFATLTGRRSQVGSIEEIFGDKGFGRLTPAFRSRRVGKRR
ncbi:protein of unknown function [Bradyrhizobium vignae]|uniref:Uncharacterized protein n=1 Tax=Bradyrhizobium vignae TaxID=1549949 RepID=A0A2U3PV85_9BRAD|nr:protein of unknown function [Bradyrhizobium vignae]